MTMLKRFISLVLLLVLGGAIVSGCVTVNKDSNPEPTVTVESNK